MSQQAGDTETKFVFLEDDFSIAGKARDYLNRWRDLLELRQEPGGSYRDNRSRSCSSQSFENISISDIVASDGCSQCQLSPESLELQTPLSSVSTTSSSSTRDDTTSSSATTIQDGNDRFSDSVDSPLKSRCIGYKYSQIEELMSEVHSTEDDNTVMLVQSEIRDLDFTKSSIGRTGNSKGSFRKWKNA